MCDSVYTVTRQGTVENYRIDVYEDTLRENGYEDVIAMTQKINMTDVKDMQSLMRVARELAHD